MDSMTSIARESGRPQGVGDQQWLQSWIQARHLAPDILSSYRHSFASHPAKLLFLTDFLVPQVADRLSRFLANEAEFQAEYGLFSVEGAVSRDQWAAAGEPERFFRLRRLVSTPAQFRMSPNALTYLQFRKAFQRDEFRAFFEAVSALTLGWSDDFGAHSMIEGDYLRPHSDDNRNRRLALVIYLSDSWRREYGGDLHVLHQDGGVTEIRPQFNSMVVFDVLAAPAHLVTPVAPAAGSRQRLTIGGWYHKID